MTLWVTYHKCVPYLLVVEQKLFIMFMLDTSPVAKYMSGSLCIYCRMSHIKILGHMMKIFHTFMPD